MPSQWEDITGTTPLTFINNCVTFTTSVSARFWLMDCQTSTEVAKMATDLYRETVTVPFMSKFMVFAKRHDQMEAKVRVFCVTDDRIDKTLETKERFVEVARSRDVEVLEGKRMYAELVGNLIPVTKSGEELSLSFHAFRENRLPFVARIRDINQDPLGRLTLMSEPRAMRVDTAPVPVCNLNIMLPMAICHSRDGESDDMSHSSKLFMRNSGLDSLKDSLMSSSSLESSFHRGRSSVDASYDEHDLLRNSGSAVDHSWSETGSLDSKEVEVEHVIMDDLLTPVIEEQEKSPVVEEQRTLGPKEAVKTTLVQREQRVNKDNKEEPIAATCFDEIEGMDDTKFPDDEENNKRQDVHRRGAGVSNRLSNTDHAIKASVSNPDDRNCTAVKSVAEGSDRLTSSRSKSDRHKPDTNQVFDEPDHHNWSNNQISSSDRNSNFETATIKSSKKKAIAQQNLNEGKKSLRSGQSKKTALVPEK